MTIHHVVSVSGGKDSTAVLLMAIQRFGRHRITPIFCDTGNEHTAVHAYLDYLEQALDIGIVRLKADFSEQIAAKRVFIARDVRTRREYAVEPVFDANGDPMPKRDGRGNVVTRLVKRKDGSTAIVPVQKVRKVGGGRRVRWSNKAKRRALQILHPTGIPFLDLCLWKGRFPSRTAQFCTEELKRNLAVAYQLELTDAGNTVVSWQGIRRDESDSRRHAKSFESIGANMYIYRPIASWTAEQVFDYCAQHSIRPNPLYLQGMKRVGCMPCHNCGKEEINQINARFPEYLEQKADWELLVSAASKRGFSTFFNKELHRDGDHDREIFAHESIPAVIEWSRTSRGGKQFDMLADLIEPAACASAYGLCEQ